MNNREYLSSLSDEELVNSPYFCNCPYGQIYKQVQAAKGNIICERDKLLNDCGGYDLSISKIAIKICKNCKLKWLKSQHE